MRSELTELGIIYDISPRIHAKTAVFPGDQAFERKVSLDCNNGDVLTLSSINTTLHLGAHTDAPCHYHQEGVGIEERSLSFYMGTAQVVHVDIPRGNRIRSSDIKNFRIDATRVLFRTNSFPNPDRWNPDFNSLSAELVTFLAKQGVRLVGIDTPSIDPAEDKTLESHHAVYRHDLAILEGIVLDHVAPGKYTLHALPLPLVGADASPVRAVLIENLIENRERS